MRKTIINTILLLLVILGSIFNTVVATSQVVFDKETVPQIYNNKTAYIPTVEMSVLDQKKMIDEKEDFSTFPRPFKFGHLHKVNLTLNNSGKWNTLPNGDKVWQLKIYAPQANTININYKKFDLPIGAKLYVYNEPTKDVLGPFTHKNEKPNQAFATGFTKGEYCIIEYHEPFNHKGKGVVEINGIVHGYKSINDIITETFKTIGSSGPCNYDVGCSLGNGWENQIKSVAMVLTEDNTGGCTGTLINTTANNCDPYLLTADHCFPNDNPGDFLNNFFMFNYDSPTPVCPGINQSPGPTNQIVHGCTVVAKSGYEGDNVDFCLLRLATNPIEFYDVYYSGWDRRNIPATGAVGIHHTSSDVKKIAVDNDPISSSNDDMYWWVRWDLGTSEGGASGSAVFDIDSKRILGQLSGGFAACNGNISNEGEEDFGKIYYGWDKVGPLPTEQLQPWLDPINSGELFIDGNACAVNLEAAFSPENNDELIFCAPSTLKLQDTSKGIPTSWSWTFSGAGVTPTSSNEQNPIITLNSNGTLVATLEVTNTNGSTSVTQSYPVSFYTCIENNLCLSPDETIPDADEIGLSSSIGIFQSNNIADISIDVDISHPYVADLIITIEHNNTKVRLLSRPNQPVSDCFEEDIMATFSDQATIEAHTMCDSSSPTISGLVIPFNSLSAFKNMNPNGTWTLNIVDVSQSDEGVLNSWCINLSTIDELDNCAGLNCSNYQFKIFLEGPYNTTTGEMTTTLNTNNLIPLAQPFNLAPYNYNGSESVVGLPSTDIVDWVLVQARDASNWNTVAESRACFVLKDGTLMDTDGSLGVNFSTLTTGTNYRFAIYHKGHLGVLTSADISAGSTNVYDFTTSQTMAEGMQQTKQTGSVFALYAGDFDNNGVINNQDFNLWSVNPAAVNAYQHYEADLNGTVNNLDYNLWTINRSKVGDLSIQLP